MKELRGWILVVVLGLVQATPVVPQDQVPALLAALTFDVASIRPARPGEISGFIKALPGGQGHTARNIPVKLMISLMYKVPMRQIQRGPEWLNTERFDVEARVDRSYSPDDLHRMYQNLDRPSIFTALSEQLGLKLTP